MPITSIIVKRYLQSEASGFYFHFSCGSEKLADLFNINLKKCFADWRNISHEICVLENVWGKIR